MLTVSASSTVGAQSIVNVERLQPREVDGAHFAAEVALDLSAGNTEVLDIEASGSAGYQSESHWIRLLGGVEFLSEEGNEIEDSRFGHLRYNYRLGQRLRSFHFAQIQTAQNLLLRRRLVLGSGLRFRLVADPKVRFDLGSGLMYERERLDEERLQPGEAERSEDVRMSNLFVLQVPLREGVELQTVLYLQPALDDLDDFRILDDVNVAIDFGRLTLRTGLRWRHDSRPPARLERDDLKLTTALSLTHP